MKSHLVKDLLQLKASMIYYPERNLTRRINIIHHSKIQLNDTVVAKRKREEEKFDMLCTSHLLTDVRYLPPDKC